jgi:hypothetical protein
MRKIILIIGTIFTTFLIISTATAVPKTNSESLINKINEIEEYKELINDRIIDINHEIEKGGIIDFLIKIILWLIGLVQQLINIVLDIFNIIDLIEYLIELIFTLFALIIALIDYILNIFTPDIIRK